MSPHSSSARPHPTPQGVDGAADKNANAAVSAPGARPESPEVAPGPAAAGRAAPPTGMRTLVVGAGAAGTALVRDLGRAPEFGLDPIGLLDDDPAKAGQSVDTVPVRGTLAELTALAVEHRAEVVALAIPGLAPQRVRALATAAAAAGAAVRYLPSFLAALRREVVGSDMRSLDVNRLIGRHEVHVASADVRDVIEGRRVLVTGAGGSIGSELCRQVHAFNPSALYMLDHDESNLHRLQLDIWGEALLTDESLVIADIRDRPRIQQIFRDLRPEVVFHAAAHKHLPLLERHPSEAVKSNVLGTDHLVEAALATGVERFVLISTDKAADPTSVLGASKRLAELIVQANARDARNLGTGVFSAVRFGNVLGSRGSLLSVLAEQFRSGGPVTVTHPDVTRFFMTIEEAVGLVLESGRMARGGEVFVLDMGEPVRIVDLVHNFAEQVQLARDEVEIRYTGLRAGEKLNEALFSADEERLATEHARIYATVADTAGGPEDLAGGLTGLYGAAAVNSDDEVRRRLAELLPGYRTPEPAPVPVLSTPYPDGF
ncbi:nucleoside-diphosphate sugar epimerase/dehydratase [Kitasatospora purpeofusca]|uniref:polysaccharide biosynthesis protein n=1 Tax=Kitasatospora purpeofusca TaxID=67352 RepID=UPI002A5A18B0|nr:nucleoside-diphosphate sugar epimerase/dehydratase [Kitasatospora purpeofusca]MDY0809944.1 nucleoside-diphosphate sugar epimerase/dehydratase [Kitasatospora purpeofusca]